MAEAALARVIPLPAPARLRPRPLPPLASGYPALDQWDVVQPGRVTFLDALPDSAYYWFAASATRRGDLMVVDGGNRFDAFRLAEVAPALGLHADGVLARTWVARAFTPYQMQALVEETGPDRLARGAATLLVSGVAEQYLDEDTPRREGLVLYRRALRSLKETARRTGAPVLVTNHSGEMHRRRGFLDLALEAADETVAFLRHEARGAAVVRLVRRGVTFVAHPEGALQQPLDRWVQPERPVIAALASQSLAAAESS